MEKQLNSSEILPRIIADSSKDPEWFAKTEHRTREIHRPDHLHVNVQRQRLDKKREWWNLYFEFRISQGIREKILAGTLDVSRSRRRTQVVWNSSLHLKENGTLQPPKWWSDSKIPVIQYSRVSVLWVVGSWRTIKETPCTSMRMLQTQSSYSESFIL